MTTPIAKLRLAGNNLGREGMSLMAQDFINQYIEHGSTYKGAMILAGKLSVIAKMATCDEYWSEQVNRGVMAAEFVVNKNGS